MRHDPERINRVTSAGPVMPFSLALVIFLAAILLVIYRADWE